MNTPKAPNNEGLNVPKQLRVVTGVTEDDLVPIYPCGTRGPSVSLYYSEARQSAAGERYAVHLIVGDFRRHSMDKDGKARCVKCAKEIREEWAENARRADAVMGGDE